MKKIKLTILCILLCCTASAARPGYPGFTFGAEWSYVATVLSYRHYNFISTDGQRVNQKKLYSGIHSNGQILLHGGYNFSRHFNLSLYTGYSGINKSESMIPVSLRGTFLLGRDPLANRGLVYLDIGTGINGLPDEARLSLSGKIGGGYRVSLSKCTKLDFLVSLQSIFTRPDVYEHNAGETQYVTEDRLRRNNAFYFAPTFGIGLTF